MLIVITVSETQRPIRYAQNLHGDIAAKGDIMMPLAGGFEFLKMLETIGEPAKKNIQIFMLSSTLNREEYQLAESNQYVTHLFSNPLPIEELLTYMKKDFCV